MEKIRILLIDDEASFTRMLKLNLERTGAFKVHCENTGAFGLTALFVGSSISTLYEKSPEKSVCRK